jgi:hypothetical protein
LLSRPKAEGPERSPRRDAGRGETPDEGHDGDMPGPVLRTGRRTVTASARPDRPGVQPQCLRRRSRNARAAPGKLSVSRAGVEGFPSGVPRDQTVPQGARPEGPPERARTLRGKKDVPPWRTCPRLRNHALPGTRVRRTAGDVSRRPSRHLGE